MKHCLLHPLQISCEFQCCVVFRYLDGLFCIKVLFYSDYNVCVIMVLLCVSVCLCVKVIEI